ncbi:RecX family transcriptional regulator [Patescibacteria group bacterium]|nr:RecX family transcriptional regulator [Patescibacteria group bacterium]
MEIKKLSFSSRSASRVFVTFSDNSYLPLDSDSVLNFHLKKNQALTPLQYQKIVDQSLFFLLKDYALRQIALSPKTEKIITQKLNLYLKKIVSKYGLKTQPSFQALIKDTLEYLNGKNLLDPQSFVDYFIRHHPKKSYQHLCLLLSRQGVPPQLLPRPDSFSSGEKDKIKKILTKKIHRFPDLSDYKSKNKLISSLLRQGFSYLDIKAVIDDWPNIS